MARVTLRGLLARKVRTLYVVLAVVFGVALIAGSYVFTDTINRTFDDLVTRSNAGTDVKVLPREPEVEGEEDPTLPASVVPRVAAVPGVREVGGYLEGLGTIVDREGESLAPTGAAVVSALPAPFDAFDYRGRPPRAPDEVAIDRGTAERGDFALGDRVRVAADRRARAYRLVGIASLGEASSLGGISLAELTLAETQRVLGRPGRVAEIYVAGEQGTEPEALRADVRAAVGPGVQVRTGEQDTVEQRADIREALGFLSTLLLAFGVVSLVVGAFSIFNTFGITIAQRTRQFALLRAVGATRAQLLRAVVLEALVIGLLGSVLGLGGGILLAPALAGLFEAIGLDLPSTSPVVLVRTVVVSLVVGTVTTVLASLVPALRATRVPPVAALREGSLAPARRPGRRRLAAGVVALALGLGLVGTGVVGGGSTTAVLGLMGSGALLAFIGVALLSTALVVPLARAVGAPLERLGGVAGRLARGNAVRNPSRTAGTASALMIGVALIALVAVLAAGLKSSFSGAFEDAVAADLVVADDMGQVPTELAGAVRAVPGVAVAMGLGGADGRLVEGGDDVTVGGVDPAVAPAVLRVPWVEGSDATLRELRGGGGAAVDTGWAEEQGLGVGSRFAVRTPRDRTVELRVAGTYDDKGGLFGPITADTATLREEFGTRRDFAVLIDVADGEEVAAVQRRLQGALDRGFPTQEAETGEEFVDGQVGQVDQIVSLFYALLSLAVVIALMGIANTLALSVHERTRELGVLRAVGASKRQVRRMVRGEALITALIGAVVGVVLGAVFAAIIAIPLADEGFAFALPVVTLAVVVVVAAVCGVLAAVSPARQASKTDVLAALGYE